MGQIAGDNVTAEYREEITKKIIGLMFCNAILGPKRYLTWLGFDPIHLTMTLPPSKNANLLLPPVVGQGIAITCVSFPYGIDFPYKVVENVRWQCSNEMKLLVGRAPNNGGESDSVAITIAKMEQPGVSRNHYQIWFDGGAKALASRQSL